MKNLFANLFKKSEKISKKGTFDEKLAELKSFMEAASKEMITDAEGGKKAVINPNDYIEVYRREINRRLIELTMNAEFSKTTDGKWNVKFPSKPANMEQLAKIGEILHSFIVQYENPLLGVYARHGWIDRNGNIVSDAQRDGMEIPDPDEVVIGANPMTSRVAFLEKVNKQAIESAILGGSGYMNMYIQVSDLAIMASNAEKFRKSRAHKAMIIGGIVLVVAAGVGVALYLYHRNKAKTADEVMDEISAEVDCDLDPDEIGVSCDIEDVSCEDIAIDDTPVVVV